MGWELSLIAGVFVVAVALAFPLAIVICVALGGILIGLDRFTAWCPGFSHLRRWFRRRRYRPGRVVTEFLAKDIRRDVLVIDASGFDAGFIVARVRTWNVLYATHGMTPIPPFGEVQTVALQDLWKWTGAAWGGPVPAEAPPEADQ